MKNKFKVAFKKHSIIVTVLFMLVSFLCNTNIVKAQTYIPINLGVIAGTGANIKQGNYTTWWKNGIRKISVNGEVAFCIEPSTIGLGGSYSIDTIIPENTQERLSKIVYYGWDTSSKTNDNYTTTQYMIWEALGATITHWYGDFGNRYEHLKLAVQAQIDRHYVVPSFNGQYEVTLGESLTIKDTNAVLNNFHVSASDSTKVSIQGNDLIITPTMDSNEEVSVVLKKVLDRHLGTSIAYRSSADDGQDVAIFKVSDPVRINLKVKVKKYGSVKIAKTDEEGTRIPNTTFKLSYNERMTDSIGEYTTGNDGTVQIDVLKPQMVYIQETSVPQNLVLNPTIHAVMIIPNQVVDFTKNNASSDGENNSFNEDKTVQIKITEHNFDPARVNLHVTRKEAGATHDANEFVDVTKEFINDRSWESSGDVHTISFTFDHDDIYQVEMIPTDLAGNVAEKKNTVIFEIDKTVPVVREKNGSSVKEDNIKFLDVYPYARKDDPIPTVKFDDVNIDHIN